MPKWHTVAEVDQLLGYGETKVPMLIIQGDLTSVKDGRSWADPAAMGRQHVERRCATSE